MHRALLSSVALLVTVTVVATAQKAASKQAAVSKVAALKWSDLKGDWEGKSMAGTSDSVVATSTITYGARKKITVKYPNRPPVAAHLIAMAGDSVIIQTDKYDSVTRTGHKVAVRMTTHVANHKAWGTFHATFDDGKSLDGRSTFDHKMK